MPPAIASVIGELYGAATGSPPDDAFLARAAGTIEQNGVSPADPPPYFVDGLGALARGEQPPPTDIDEGDWGMAWALREIAGLVPGATFEEQGARTTLAVPSLGRALVIERGDGYAERWTIAAHVPAPPLRPTTPRYLGTFGPTLDQVRAWARDPLLHFTEQDEELALASWAYVDIVLELLDDPATLPEKRPMLLDALREVARQRTLTGDPGAAAYVAELAARLRRASSEDARALGAKLSTPG